MQKQLNEAVKLEMLAAEIKVILTRPYWSRQDCLKVLGLSADKMVEIERAGDGPPWLKIGGTPMITADTAQEWFKGLPNSKWSKSKTSRLGAPI